MEDVQKGTYYTIITRQEPMEVEELDRLRRQGLELRGETRILGEHWRYTFRKERSTRKPISPPWMIP